LGQSFIQITLLSDRRLDFKKHTVRWAGTWQTTFARIGGSLAESQTALAVVATAHHSGVSKHGFK